MAGVAARDPHPLLAGDAADDRQEVEHQPEDPGPAVLDGDRPADQLGDERLERALDPGRDLLVGRELRLERPVAEAAREDAPVGRLLPVVEAVAPVVRAFEEPLRERLGRDHLAARRDDQPLDLAEQAARVPVRRDQHLLGLDVVERLDAAVLPDLDAGLGGQHGEPPHPAGGLERRVAGVEDRRAKSAVQRLLDPLGGEAVGAQRLELDRERIPLLVVGGEAQAAGAAEGVAREALRAGRAPPRSAARSPAPGRGRSSRS